MMRKSLRRCVFGFFVAGAWSFECAARVLPFEYQRVATHYDIPVAIFFSIALAESGYRTSGIYNPWPWTLNIEGEPYRFDTAVDAVAVLRDAIAQGKHADIGIMQVNSLWHAHRVAALSDLLHPHTSLHVGAMILVEQRRRSQSWWEAVGRYHAPGRDAASLQRAQRYRDRVRSIYQQITEEK